MNFKIPHNWLHARLIDYHQHVNWAILWCSLSPDDEMFVWQELWISPEKYTTEEIAHRIIDMSGEYEYRFNLIDPLARTTQPNTGYSTIDDLNRIFRDSGHRCLWRPWTTKTETKESKRGREEMRRRLKNSLLVEKPFNNTISEGGVKKKIPTIWFFRNCTETIKSMGRWRLQEWATQQHRQTKERKEVPQTKWSHFCTCLEGILKERGWRPRALKLPVVNEKQRRQVRSYFGGRD